MSTDNTRISRWLRIPGFIFIGVAIFLIAETIFKSDENRFTNGPFDALIALLFMIGALFLLFPFIQSVVFRYHDASVEVGRQIEDTKQQVSDVTHTQSQIQETQRRLEKIVENLQFVTGHLMSKYEIEHLEKLKDDKKFEVDLDSDTIDIFILELHNLRNRKLIEDKRAGDLSIEKLSNKVKNLSSIQKDKNKQVNIKAHGSLIFRTEIKNHQSIEDR